MICRVVYILIMCHLSELGDAVKFLFVKKKTKKKKNFLLYFAIHRRNEGVVTLHRKKEGRSTQDTLVEPGLGGITHCRWNIFL
jgi:hypothetical protein